MNTNRTTRKQTLQKHKSSIEKLSARKHKNINTETAIVASSPIEKKKKKLKRHKKRLAGRLLEPSINSEIQLIASNNLEQLNHSSEVDSSPGSSPRPEEVNEQADPKSELEFNAGFTLPPPSPSLLFPQNDREQRSVECESLRPSFSPREFREMDSDASLGNDFLVWKMEVKKDINALFKQNDRLVKSVKEIKQIVGDRHTRRYSPPSRYSTSDEEIEFGLLPDSKLKKVWQVVEMETSVNENRMYKKQLIKKMATFGGNTIKDCVINIFNGMFTKKVRTKMCWIGTPKKEEFRKFTGIRNVLRRAVKTRIRECSLADIDKECKLRFNQAQKDYDREKEKKRMKK